MTKHHSQKTTTVGRTQMWLGRLSSLMRPPVIAITILVLALAFIGVWRIRSRAQAQLAEERERLEKQNIVPFEKKFYSAIANNDIQVWQSYKATRAIARFGDSYFVATDGGLVELDRSGNFVRHYTVLDGLPESDLLSLVPFNAKLFIGTRSQGLVSFDGQQFEGYRWTDRAAQSVNVLFEDKGRLLIGTMAGGLIGFDGRQFREVKVGTEHQRLLGIELLAHDDSRLYIGTFADGLWIEEGARWSHFAIADGLLSNRIVGVVSNDRDLFVASDYGLAVASLSSLSTEPAPGAPQRFRSVAVLPSLSSMTRYGADVALSKDNGDTFEFSASADLTSARQVSPVGTQRPGDLAGCRLTAIGQDLWMLSSEGLLRSRTDHNEKTGAQVRATQVAFSPWGQTSESLSITTNLVSALALDSQGRVWAGSFRNGIDVLTPQGKKISHIETEDTREINSLIRDEASKTVLAATSRGVLRFDAGLRPVEHVSVREGLLSSSVLQVVQMKQESATEARGSAIACATSKGLSLSAGGKLRGLTTVQGLPSNSLYTVLNQGRRTYVGTLGGLALIEDGRVVRVFKDTNSKLTNNWVTALCAIGPRLFVGTYGGGVFELTESGELRAFLPETGRAVVNPNAMWSDGSRLYVGTLDGALIFNLYSQQWTRLKAELPARTVLSITGDEKYVYFGTTSGIARFDRSFWSQGTL